jgi:hypothetical protein
VVFDIRGVGPLVSATGMLHSHPVFLVMMCNMVIVSSKYVNQFGKFERK